MRIVVCGIPHHQLRIQDFSEGGASGQTQYGMVGGGGGGGGGGALAPQVFAIQLFKISEVVNNRL